jgi:hypothetical protein
MLNIAIVNATSVMSDADAEKIVAALQTQVNRDFAPTWGMAGADLGYIPVGEKFPGGMWQLILLDNSDVAGALGYHDLTHDGFPIGKAFVGTDLNYGTKPSVTISHELLEMLGDPDISMTTFVQKSEFRGRLYAYESCDAVEADNLGYDIDGVTVSDFVTREWFQPFPHPLGTKFSFRENVHQPLELAPGGYIGVYDLYGAGWSQLTADRPTYKSLPSVGSRRERRARRWGGNVMMRSVA